MRCKTPSISGNAPQTQQNKACQPASFVLGFRHPNPFCYKMKAVFISSLLAISTLCVAAEMPGSSAKSVEEPPMSYRGAPYLLWNMARWNDTIILCEELERTVLPKQGNRYQAHIVKVRVLKTVKGAPLPDEFLTYTLVYEVCEKTRKNPGTYPMSGQMLLGFNRDKFTSCPLTHLRHAGNLTLSRLNPTALQHLPMVKRDYPELFE